MDKEYLKKVVTRYRKIHAEEVKRNPFPEQTDEEKRLAQKELAGIMDEMKPLRQNANRIIL